MSHYEKACGKDGEHDIGLLDQDQIIGVRMARSIQFDAARKHPLLVRIVTQDQDAYDGQFVARLVTDAPTPYVLLADTLEGLHIQLPSGMEWSDRQPADPPEARKTWFLPTRQVVAPTRSTSPTSTRRVFTMAVGEKDAGNV